MTDVVDQVLEFAEQLAAPFEGLHRIGVDGLVYAYHDPVGFPTQGYGRLLSRQKWESLSKYPPITVETAEAWLVEDLGKAYRSADRLIKVELTPQQTAALVDFAFNAGPGNLQISTLLKLVNREEHEEAADQFLRWVYAGAVKLPGLVRRAKARRELYLSGTTQ